MDLFQRTADNPILTPERWWEEKGVLNPGVARSGGTIHLLYRAVGSDGISRFGMATSEDGRHFDRQPLPWHEVTSGDWDGRLGIEDPRITAIESRFYVTYAKVAVDPAFHPKLSWEPAPFHIRSWIAETVDFESLREIGPVLSLRTTKDFVLFPEKIKGRFVGLVRQYPSIQLTTSVDLRTWSEPVMVLEPRPETWEAERVGAGPPPVRVAGGWLLLYHANEYLRFPGNQRMYRMGLALLDERDPSRVLYRHPHPVFAPSETYECEGPVGNIVFGTGLVVDRHRFHLYYGAGDGVIGLATARRNDVLDLIPGGNI